MFFCCISDLKQFTDKNLLSPLRAFYHSCSHKHMLDTVLATMGRCHLSTMPGAGCSGGLSRAVSLRPGLQPAVTTKQSTGEACQVFGSHSLQFFPQNSHLNWNDLCAASTEKWPLFADVWGFPILKSGMCLKLFIYSRFGYFWTLVTLVYLKEVLQETKERVVRNQECVGLHETEVALTEIHSYHIKKIIYCLKGYLI